MNTACDRRWEIDAHREGRLGDKEIESFERHLRACASCRAYKADALRLRELAGALPGEPPDEVRLKRLRAHVLRDVATGAKARGRWRRTGLVVAASIAIAVAGGGWAALAKSRGAGHPASGGARVAAAAPGASAPAVIPSEPREPETFASSVTPAAGARWTRLRDAGVERVTLEDGTLAIHVRHQNAAERFLVALPDGELEVRGTTFDVSASAGATARVHVDEGLVELRIRGLDVARIGAGETWTPAAIAPSLVPGAVATRPVAAASAAATAPSQVADEGATAYASAVELLRDGRADDAAVALQAFVLAHPRASQMEDASFLEAVALARAGRIDAAGLAAEQHLARSPGSFRRKDAAILVARAAVLRGDCDRARTVRTPWPDDGEAKGALGSCSGR